MSGTERAVETDLNLGDRVHLISDHRDGVVQGFGQKFDHHRQRNVPAVYVLWDGDEQPVWWALEELEPARKPPRLADLLPPRPWRQPAAHGSNARYSSGCRCDECRRARREYDRAKRIEKGLPVRSRAQIADDERAELMALQEAARQSGLSRERREAAGAALATLLGQLHERGVSIRQIARCAGITHAAVLNRLKRYGHGAPPEKA